MEQTADLTLSQQAQDEKGVLSFILGFAGLFTFTSYVFTLFMSGALYPLGESSLSVPVMAVVAICATIVLLIPRLTRSSFNQGSLLAIRIVGFICTVAGPLILLFTPLSIVGAIVIAVGIVGLGFHWILYMCRFARDTLGAMLALTMILSALFCGLLLMNAPGSPYILLCIMGAISWITALSIRGLNELDLVNVSFEDSVKRALTVRVDRWTFSLIGLDLGFSVALLHYFVPMAMPMLPAGIPVWIFVVPTIIVGLLLLIPQTRFKNLLADMPKNYLSFTFALSIFATFFLPSYWSIIGLVLLMITSVLQAAILVNASIEFIRFEELSPLWYLGEEAFVSGGLALGIIGGWIAVVLSPGVEALFIVACIAILINSFSQHFINEGRFPSADNIPLEGLEEDEAEEAIVEDLDQELRGKAWSDSLTRICQDYNLSPRQSEILKLLANGRDAVYIENFFCISKSTAKCHIYNIYKKLGIHSRQELIDIVERNE